MIGRPDCDKRKYYCFCVGPDKCNNSECPLVIEWNKQMEYDEEWE